MRDMYAARDEMVDRAVAKAKREAAHRRPSPEPMTTDQAARGFLVIALISAALICFLALSGCAATPAAGCYGGYSNGMTNWQCGVRVPG